MHCVWTGPNKPQHCLSAHFCPAARCALSSYSIYRLSQTPFKGRALRKRLKPIKQVAKGSFVTSELWEPVPDTMPSLIQLILIPVAKCAVWTSHYTNFKFSILCYLCFFSRALEEAKCCSFRGWNSVQLLVQLFLEETTWNMTRKLLKILKGNHHLVVSHNY